jgi:hypothetical protein
MYAALKNYVAAGPVKLDSPEADERVGFLFDHRTVYTVAQGPVATVIMPTFNYINPRGQYLAPSYGKEFPLYDLHEVAVNMEVPEVTDMAAKLSMMFGSSILHKRFFDSGNFVADLQNLHREVQYYYGGVMDVYELPVDAHKRMLTEIVGDIRNIFAILLWLNSLPHTVKYTNAPAGHRLIKGKRVAMAAHNVVTIHLHGTVQVRNLFAKALKRRESPREHDVRGFWRHHGGIPQGCGHAWPEIPDKRNKFVCSKCGRERWWVHAHKRGDANKGTITKEYRTEI